MNLPTLRWLFDYNDWGRDRLMHLAESLDDAKLDRPFEMGLGSLRATLFHIYGAEWLWLSRWQGRSPKRIDEAGTFATMAALGLAWKQHGERRNAWMSTLTQADLDKNLAYTNTKGDPFIQPLGLQMLHVANHGTHHRAQALNMLRHLGVPPPAMDFVVMLREKYGPNMPDMRV